MALHAVVVDADPPLHHSHTAEKLRLKSSATFLPDASMTNASLR